MLIYEEPEVIKVYYEQDNELIVHEWLDYNPDSKEKTIYEIMQRLYEILVEYPVEKVLVIADKTRGSFSPNIQKYIGEVQVPRLLADTKMRFVATVMPEDSIVQIGTEIWQERLKSGARFILYEAPTESIAREWLDKVSNSEV